MRRLRWMGTIPALVAVCGLGGAWLAFPQMHWAAPASAPGTRIRDPHFHEVEAVHGGALYAPTWLPQGGQPGPVGIRRGVHRVLADFENKSGVPLCILAQERRTRERDEYNRKQLQEPAEAKGHIAEGKTGYFVTGESGERRLFWFEEDAALVLSSNVLTDGELLRVAAGVRNQ